MNYTLMHRQIPVLDMELDGALGAVLSIGTVHNARHIPVGIANDNRVALTKWWNKRSIPASRSGLRDALERLGIPLVQMLVKESYGLSLSDQYWIRPENSGLRWEDINFFDNPFSEDVGNILFGGQASKDGKLDLISPDSTSDGWLKKRWKIVNGKRCLLKGGSPPFYQEPLNEALTSIICRRLGIPHVEYSLMWDNGLPYSVCEDFIDSRTDLVSAWQICDTLPMEDDADIFNHFTDCCHTLGIPGVPEALDRMLTLDYIIVNFDRHFSNFGAVRDAETLEWIGAAPLFDNGTSLWCQTVNMMINPEANLESVTFRRKQNEQIKLVCDFEWLDLASLNGIEDEFEATLSASPHIDEERTRFLCGALKRRVELLGTFVQSQTPGQGLSL